ncbi:hypothetical protein [Terribacillus saccharophilus]|uniref:hypothetical protein n=1 Tax=Terribacillus saccharophilus TaxID=361277 RepID=UPI003D2A72C2
MLVQILDKKKELNNNTCYLCTFSLRQYLESLPDDFMEYNIQRGIVSNIYLDNLIETVLKKGHIPLITLVSDEVKLDQEDNVLTISSFRILDGLQRTYKLKVIWDTILLLEEEYNEEILNLSKYQVSKKFRQPLREIDSSSTLIMKLIEYCKENSIEIKKLKECFEVNQWFEVWENLSPEEEVEKMLILNAGHKQMSLKHQLELLFLNLLPIINEIGLKESSEFHLLREREITPASYSKRRKRGQFYFPHFISATLSFIEKDVITTNTNLIKKMQENENLYKELNIYLNFDFIKEFVEFLVKLDILLYERYGESGIQWISRETVMIGLFGALGKISYDNHTQIHPEETLNEFLYHVREGNRDYLNIDGYNKSRSNIDIAKVNIGNITKTAVYEGIYNLVQSKFVEPINWENWFRGDMGGN